MINVMILHLGDISYDEQELVANSHILGFLHYLLVNFFLQSNVDKK